MLDQFLAVGIGVLPVFVFDIFQQTRQLHRRQGGLGVIVRRLVHGGFFSDLPPEINQHIDDDQGDRHPRRRFERGFVLNRHGQKHGRIVNPNDTIYTPGIISPLQTRGLRNISRLGKPGKRCARLAWPESDRARIAPYLRPAPPQPGTAWQYAASSGHGNAHPRKTAHTGIRPCNVVVTMR